MKAFLEMLEKLTVLSVLLTLLEKTAVSGTMVKSVRLAGGLMVMLMLVKGLSECLR